ncbi:competence/damage-inducible protein A [Fructilactobacillus florum]|uniref:Putative competence-damage inducible protein n=1 Tax=Fructilactobacillus florum DSM 22689 = JCM 16035 TaxID=1423745 RepID=A0A0R2CMC7_9LACO|nr:competence/damage-inducible protein A [Fructilactobacillus florum]KRM92426.1 competence-damage inducible protein [Fructilactobacillus florum DSM 22689 = JCM 16035]
MKAEMISVGTELLLGQIIDTNSQFLARLCAELGIDLYFETTVGDNPTRLQQVINQASQRSDLVILIGGLGPTADDLTKQVMATELNCQLVTDQVAQDKINHFYQESTKEKPHDADRMAQYLAGSQVFPNDQGFAVGMLKETKKTAYLVLPGPPAELQPMVTNYAQTALAQLNGSQRLIKSKVMRFFGIGEPALEDRLQVLIQAQTNPTLAAYAKQNEVTLRLTATGSDPDQVDAMLQTLSQQVLDLAGSYFYGFGDQNSLPAVVVAGLRQHQLTVTAAESLTGGLFQSQLTGISHASDVFPGGFVTYAPRAKEALVGVASDIIAKNGVVSEPTAIAMALGAQRVLQTDLALSFTGVAGPAALEGHPAGFFWVGLALPTGKVVTKAVTYPKPRNEVRDYAVKVGLKLIYDYLKDISNK